MWISSKFMTVPGSLHTGFPNGALNASGAQITFANCPLEVKLLLIETPEVSWRINKGHNSRISKLQEQNFKPPKPQGANAMI